MKTFRFVIAVVLAMMAAAGTACAGGALSSPSPTGVPEGTFIAQANGVNEVDVEVKFANGRFAMDWGGHVAANGPYAANRDTAVFVGEPVQGESMCKDVEEPGVYKWAMQGSTLVFTKVEDSCIYRVAVLTSNPLTKK